MTTQFLPSISATLVYFIFSLTALFVQSKKDKRIKTSPHSISTFIFTQSKHIKTFET